MREASLADLAKCRTDALFLLVGSNPLPNYVAARLLLNDGGMLYLVHSKGLEGSGEVAQRLAMQLRQYQPCLVDVDRLNSDDIRSQLQTCLDKVGANSLGLNYTGGTKVMAAHAYGAVKEFGCSRDLQPVFSYLDADTLSLTVEPRPGQPGFSRKIVNCVQPSLEDILDLHALRLKGDLQPDPNLPELARALARQFGTPDGKGDWGSAREDLFSSGGQPWDQVKDHLASKGIIDEVITHLESGLGFANGQPIGFDAAASRAGFKSPGQLNEWLQAKWLEDWVLSCVRELGCQQRSRSLEGYLPASHGSDEKHNFEVDVIALRGYQLFAFSCTVTTERKVTKLKFLEGYTRARQLGGEEARAALVAPIADPDKMEREIRHEWEGAQRVRVFGRTHLPRLKEEIDSWFKTV
jgi:hypothetical protein